MAFLPGRHKIDGGSHGQRSEAQQSRNQEAQGRQEGACRPGGRDQHPDGQEKTLIGAGGREPEPKRLCVRSFGTEA